MASTCTSSGETKALQVRFKNRSSLTHPSLNIPFLLWNRRGRVQLHVTKIFLIIITILSDTFSVNHQDRGTNICWVSRIKAREGATNRSTCFIYDRVRTVIAVPASAAAWLQFLLPDWLIRLVCERIPDTWRINGEEASWPPSQVYGYTKSAASRTHGRCVWWG